MGLGYWCIVFIRRTVNESALRGLHAYASVTAAKQGLERYISKYNRDRPHSSLDRLTPDEFYFKHLPATPKAEGVLNFV
uniref:integrase core domain-containing protein n=1 Tax=Methylophilus sp. DW102 TaxID=3095607 RepID=UPI00403FA2BA